MYLHGFYILREAMERDRAELSTKSEIILKDYALWNSPGNALLLVYSNNLVQTL
jgi:hypothetical protein